MDLESGCGVQVVTIKDDHTYQLDTEALRGILLQEDVKDYPVVVVSVAGAYRGGKSFLLDFFLRYLYFKYSSPQNNTSRVHDKNVPDDIWLGSDDESLKGFSWRGGSKRDTTGLVLWSQPIHATLSSGEKVVVLLMDTQGTFDGGSTVRDCSTIFALSTLLSSLQIYNISQNIREDNLQHLQLFAEYGKLASNSNQKPFQKLKFLVRDWSYYYEHAFGAEGGTNLLQEKMKVYDDQAPEFKQLRENIMSSFEDVSCFLMPYPGDAVACDPKFTGKLTDIREAFKQSLKELGPLVLEPQNLVVKKINGQIIKAKDLYHYFEAYLDEFNSDKLTSPVTITRALTKAGIYTAKDQARKVYYTIMEQACDTSQPNLTTKMLRELHNVTVNNALQHFKTSLKNVISICDSNESHLTQLEQEFESKLPQYETINSAKMRMSLDQTRAAYEEAIKSIWDTEKQCLHPRDLEECHEIAVESAMKCFDSNRIPSNDVEDEARNAILNELGHRLRHLQLMNETMNKKAVSESSDSYFTYMENLLGTKSCMNREYLEQKHDEALTMSLDYFASMRIKIRVYEEDFYLSKLKKKIDQRYGTIQNVNIERNEAAVKGAMSSYNVNMETICSLHLPCLHPEDFRQEHEDARDTAINEFHSRRLGGENENDNDEYKDNLIQQLSVRYEELYNLNETNNENAVADGLSAYNRAMNAACQADLLPPTEDHLVALHNLAVSNQALRVFYEKRRSGPEHSYDKYRDNLMRAVDERFTLCQEINNRNRNAFEAKESNFLETCIAVAGTAAIAGGVTAAVLVTGGVAAVASAGAAAAGGTVLTMEGVVLAATTAAGVAGTVAAGTWNSLRSALNIFRKKKSNARTRSVP